MKVYKVIAYVLDINGDVPNETALREVINCNDSHPLNYRGANYESYFK